MLSMQAILTGKSHILSFWIHRLRNATTGTRVLETDISMSIFSLHNKAILVGIDFKKAFWAKYVLRHWIQN